MFLAGVACQIAPAAELSVSKTRFHYTVIDQSISDALLQFGRDLGFRIVVSDQVTGRVTSRISGTGIESFLETITLDYGLEWYYDGSAIYVTAKSEAKSVIVRLPVQELPVLRATLAKAGVTDSRNPFKILPGAVSVVVDGPPRFIGLVKQMAAAMPGPDAPGTLPVENALVTIYRGNQSQTINFGGGKT